MGVGQGEITIGRPHLESGKKGKEENEDRPQEKR